MIALNRTIAGSKDGSDVCADSRSMTRQTDSAESTMNSATSFAADPVTTNTFPQAADAVAFSTTPASRWASCRSHNQNIQAARRAANGARRDRTAYFAGCSTGGHQGFMAAQ